MEDPRLSTMDETPIVPVTISGGRLSATVVSQGAALQDVRLEGCPFSLVLGHQAVETYRTDTTYAGAIVGRVANRISRGRFTLDGRAFHLDRNDNDLHTLHGGSSGIRSKNWNITETTANSVTLAVVDRGSQTGFPGDCRISVTYRISDTGTLEITATSSSDEATPCSVAPHPYFTLGGSADIHGHEIRILADRYLPVDGDLLPTGEIAPVEGSPFDLRDWRAMGSLAGGFDQHFCTETKRVPLRLVAEARSPVSGISLLLETTEPGLQFYTGRGLSPPFAPFSGFCFEPHDWPDAPNRPNFPACIIRPGETLVQRTHLTFRRN